MIASQDQLARMERAIRAMRGSNATPVKGGAKLPKTVLEEHLEDHDGAVPFTVEAALKYFEPSSPIHTDAVMQAAKEAAEESAKLGPSAQEMYYASYKAAMESATSQIADDFNTAAVLAAAAGAARSARAHAAGATSLRTHEGLASHGVPPSLESRDRVGRLLARRRAAAKAADVSGAAKVGVFKGTEGAGRVLASVNEAERSLEYREGGPLKGKAKEAYRAGFESAMRDAGVAPSPSPATGMKKSTPRVAIPKLAIKGSPADLELHGGGGVTAPLAPRGAISESPTTAGNVSTAAAADADDDRYTSSEDFSSDEDEVGESTLKLAAGLDTTAAQEAAVAAIEAVARDAELDVASFADGGYLASYFTSAALVIATLRSPPVRRTTKLALYSLPWKLSPHGIPCSTSPQDAVASVLPVPQQARLTLDENAFSRDLFEVLLGNSSAISSSPGPSFSDDGSPFPGAGREFVISTHLDQGGATWDERDRILAKAYRTITLRIMDGRL